MWKEYIFYLFILVLFVNSFEFNMNNIILIFGVGIIIYFYIDKDSKINGETVTNSLKNNNIYEYGSGKKNGKIVLSNKNIKELETIKKEIDTYNLIKKDKNEIIIKIKNYFEIYDNINNYNYKNYWLEDLELCKTNILDFIEQLINSNFSKKSDLKKLYLLIQSLIDKKLNGKGNQYMYNTVNYPKGVII